MHVRHAAEVAAKIVTKGRSKNDASRLNCFELEEALEALGPEGDAAPRAKLVRAYHEVANVKVSTAEQKQDAAEVLRTLLAQLQEFMQAVSSRSTIWLAT